MLIKSPSTVSQPASQRQPAPLYIGKKWLTEDSSGWGLGDHNWEPMAFWSGAWAGGYFISLSLVQCSWGCAAPEDGRAEVGCWGGMLLRDSIALGKLEVLQKGASAGVLLRPAEVGSFCINLVLSPPLASVLRNTKACENKEQKMRKLYPWISEATALEWWALSA